MAEPELTPLDPEIPSGPSPGALLAEARQDLQWTVEDVAASLNLRVSVIEALEMDDYAELPGPTFVRGYLRSYARLVGLDDSEIVDDDRFVSVSSGEMHTPERLLNRVDFRSRATVAHGSGGKTALVIVVLLIIVVGAWVLSGQDMIDFGKVFSGVGGGGSGSQATEITIPLGSGSGGN